MLTVIGNAPAIPFVGQGLAGHVSFLGSSAELRFSKIQTRTVTVDTVTLFGTVQGLHVSIRLSAFGKSASLVTQRPVVGYTDATGKFTANLWQNDADPNKSVYLLTIIDPTNNKRLIHEEPFIVGNSDSDIVKLLESSGKFRT